MDYKLAAKNFFDTLEVEAEAAVVQSLALERGINFFYPSEDRVRFSFDDVTTPEEVNEESPSSPRPKAKKPRPSNCRRRLPSRPRSCASRSS